MRAFGCVGPPGTIFASFAYNLVLDPPVPIGLPRLAPSGGEFIDGYWVPEGVSISPGGSSSKAPRQGSSNNIY
jgi:hypothetical protein